MKTNSFFIVFVQRAEVSGKWEFQQKRFIVIIDYLNLICYVFKPS